MNFVAYDAATGRITRSGFAPDGHEEGQAIENEAVLTGNGNDRDNYVVNGLIAEFTTEEKYAKNNLPQGFIWKMPERTAVDTRSLESAKAQAWTKIKASRTGAEGVAFICNGHTYDANVEKISGAVQLALLSNLGGQPFSIDWTLADNSVITLDGPGMTAVGVALGQHINTVYDTARDLRTQVDLAPTVTQVDLIKWPS